MISVRNNYKHMEENVKTLTPEAGISDMDW